MRLILTTIILMIFAQPVPATTVDAMYQKCKTWQNSGFNDELFMFNEDGARALQCHTYMNALMTVGGQNWLQPDVAPQFGWHATEKQLAQLFINSAEAQPELWHATPYVLIIAGNAYQLFPCKE